MCLKENYSDSPSPSDLPSLSPSIYRYSDSPSPSIYNVNMNSKSGKQQKKDHHVRRNPNFDSNSDKGQNDNALILGRVSMNTRPSLRNALTLGRALKLDSTHP